MSTEARTIVLSGRSALFTVWTVAVSILAAAALIVSGLALNVASENDRSVSAEVGAVEAASVGSPLWDAGKLHAMELRMDLAEAAHAAAAWDAGKLEAMETRMELAEAAQAEGTDGR